MSFPNSTIAPIMSRFDAMAHNSLGRQPPSYLRSLPNDTFVTSNGSYYRVWGGGFASHYVRNISGLFPVEREIDLRFRDPFSQGAVATLPTGHRYGRRGDIWLLMTTPGATPVNLLRQVPGHQEYWMIQQAPYVGGAPVVTPLTISFNLPMSLGKSGNFTGAGEPAFPATVAALFKGKITIVVDIVTTPGEHGTLKSSSQVNVSTNITKGRLAAIIVEEVEKALATASNIVAFCNEMYVGDLSFKLADMLLVDLVRMSRSTYQPTIALRV